jgi:site-specific DNA recombinase
VTEIAALRAAIYARYSTDKQDPRSIEDQVRVCTRLIEQRGVKLTAVFSDAAMSGATAARPGLRQLLAAAQAGEFDILVVESLDRLSRDHADLAWLFRELTFHGVRIVTVADGDVELMHVGVQGLMNAISLKTVAMQTHRDLESAVLKGRFAGGRCYGYRTVRAFNAAGIPVKGEREIDPVEADIVVRIFREYAEGKSAKAIAAGLNKDGMAGPRGGIWRQNTINGNRARGTGILNNELYVGTYVWNRLEYKTKAISLGGRPASPRKSTSKPGVSRLRTANQIVRVPLPDLRIVPQDLWDAVKARQKALDAKLQAQQAMSGGRNRRSGIGATRRSLTVLAGVLFCGNCGGKMTPSGGRYLRCSTAAETGGSVCDHSRNHRRDVIEAQVLAALSDELMRPDALEHFIDVYNREVAGATARHAVERQATEAELARVDKEIANLVTAIAGGLNNPSVKVRLDDLEAERAIFAAESEKPAPAAISLHPGAASLWRAKIRALRAALDGGDGAELERETLRGLIERVTLVPDRTAEHGFVIELEGRLAEMLQVVGIKKADAELVDSASAVSGQLVAGARNHRAEPFRLQISGVETRRRRPRS